MLRIWFERGMPPEMRDALDGKANALGPGSGSVNETLATIGPAHAVIASSLITYDGSVMDLAPELCVIARTGIGYDKVDLAAATERGIAVCNAPDAPTTSTAEHAMALLFAVAKRVEESQAELRGGGRDFFASHQGIELAGLTIGLVGLGRIGRAVATMASAFGMSVLAYDPYVDRSSGTVGGIQMVADLGELLAVTDVVSLHLPLTVATHNLIDAAAIRQMKPSAILINTARGGLVDHDALLAALDQGEVFGAGLDVTNPEPLPPHHPLLHRHDVVVTPHVAAATAAGKARLYQSAVGQALQVLRGERPPHLVNSEVWPVRRPSPTMQEN